MSLDQIRRQWEGFGRQAPLWSILTRDQPWQIDEFFQTGREHVGHFWENLQRYNVPKAFGRALDFGCGVGRLTQPWSQHFDEVYGVDISGPMIEQARAYNQERNPRAARCQFVLNTQGNLRSFPDGHFDLVFTFIVLQHMPARFSAGYLREFARVLAPGGSLIFQLPTGPLAPPPWWMKLYRAAYYRLVWDVFIRKPRMEMHGVSQDKVREILSAGAVDVLHVESDGAAGPQWESLMYYCRKRH
jgi:SAM-dependent methyltransferase